MNSVKFCPSFFCGVLTGTCVTLLTLAGFLRPVLTKGPCTLPIQEIRRWFSDEHLDSVNSESSEVATNATNSISWVNCQTRSCLGLSPVHRSVVLLAYREVAEVFHGPGFFPMYVFCKQQEVEDIWNKDGVKASFWLDIEKFQDLPFSDLQVDVVVLDLRSFDPPEWPAVLTEAVRILAQRGVLFVRSETANLMAGSVQASKLLENGQLPNSFVRLVGMVKDLEVCSDCGMTSMFGVHSIVRSPLNQCQAWIPPNYSSVFQPAIAQKFDPSKKESLEIQRLRLWSRSNVLKTQRDKIQWTDRYHENHPDAYKAYIGPEPEKEWRHLGQLWRSGKLKHVKRLLDAGSGTCTLEGGLRRMKLLSRLSVYLAFGVYDCSMLRVCAERGAVAFQHNWLNPLPICANCKFDLIFQSGGVHHMKKVEDHTLFLNNMLAHLECNGLLFVTDGGDFAGPFREALKSQIQQKRIKMREAPPSVEIYLLC